MSKERPAIARRVDSVESDPIRMYDSLEKLKSHPQIMTEAVEEVLNHPRETSIQEKVATSMRMSENITFLTSRIATPAWMNKSGVMKVSKELSSSQLWEDALGEVRIEHNQFDLLETTADAKSIAINNAGFLTSAIGLGLLAAGAGSNIEKCIHKGRRSFNKDFARSIGLRYDTPAKDENEFLGRVQDLVPNPDKQDARGEGTLYGELIKYRSFDSRRMKCPAIFLTHVMFNEWGKQLDTNEKYQDRFKKTVKKKTPIYSKYIL